MEVKIYNKPSEKGMAVREEVFIKEQGFSYDRDETDDRAYHIVLFEGETAIGVCRMFESDEKNVYILGRLAVAKEHRGKGYGKIIIEKAVEYVKSLKGEGLILHSQMQVKEFYKKLGFVEYGEIEYEEGCPHIWMKIEI